MSDSTHYGQPRLDRVPPQNIDAERAILGSMLFPGKSLEVVPRVMEKIREEMFYKEAHRHIFNAIIDVFEEGVTPDLLTVTQRLEETGQLELVGGVPFINEMIDSVPDPENAEFYCGLMLDPYVRRRVLYLGAEIYNRAYDDKEKISQIIGEAQEEILDIQRGTEKKAITSMSELMKSTFDVMQEAYDKPEGIIGIPTGFPRLDTLMAGMHPSDFIVIAGRPGHGKSALAQKILLNVAEQKIPTMFFSLEMSKEQIGLRIMSSVGNVNLQSMRTGDLTEWDMKAFALTAKKYTTGDVPFYVDDTPGLSTHDLVGKAYRYHTEHGIKLMAVDYMQLMNDPEKGRDNREREMSAISGCLKMLAKRLKIPVIGLSQLNRRCEERKDKRPMLSDLRDSGAIEQDADAVIFVYRDAKYNDVPDDRAELILAKQRNGPAGVTVDVGFTGIRTAFEPL